MVISHKFEQWFMLFEWSHYLRRTLTKALFIFFLNTFLGAFNFSWALLLFRDYSLFFLFKVTIVWNCFTHNTAGFSCLFHLEWKSLVTFGLIRSCISDMLCLVFFLIEFVKFTCVLGYGTELYFIGICKHSLALGYGQENLNLNS